MQFEDPKSMLEAAAARPSRDLDAPALVKKGTRLRRRRLAAAVAGTAVAVAAASTAFGVIGKYGEPRPGPVGNPPADCESDDLRCMAEYVCSRPAPLHVSIFLRHGATRDQVAELRARVLADPGVEEAVHFSEKEAYEEFKTLYEGDPELWGTIPPDALPASLRVRASSEEAVERIRAISSPIVEEIRSGLEIRRRLCADDKWLPAPVEDASPVGHGPVRVELPRAECGTGASGPIGQALEPEDGSKWCRFILLVENAGDEAVTLDPDSQVLWATNGNAFTPWEEAADGALGTRLFGSRLAAGEQTLGEVVFLLGPEAVPASLELELVPGYPPQRFSLDYDCAADLRDEPRGRCFFRPDTAPSPNAGS